MGRNPNATHTPTTSGHGESQQYIIFHQCLLLIAPCLTSQSCEPLRACFSEAEKLNELQISDPLTSIKPSVIFPTVSAAGSRSGDGTADSTCAQHRHAAASGPEEPQPPGQQQRRRRAAAAELDRRGCRCVFQQQRSRRRLGHRRDRSSNAAR